VPHDSTSAEHNFQNDARRSIIVKARKPEEVKVTLDMFELQTQLGRGTFGKVFLAKLLTTGEEYAIKVIRKDMLLEYDQIESTLLEKEILFSADHPFLLGMDFLFQTDTRLYFVMPFVRGGELYKILMQEKRFPEPVVKFYIAQIVMAIGHLHSKGIMHRDLKLENILVSENGYLRIIDYGLAKLSSETSLAQTYCGTPEYLAPEMIQGTGHD
jgi:serine/threonine protein kinase